MKERPILFSGAMVRALLAGTKTQTRRIVKPEPHHVDGGVPFGDPPAWAVRDGAARGSAVMVCPYGKRGDRLWVREAWRTVAGADGIPPRDLDAAYRLWFEAEAPHQPGFGKLRPGMFMPRWASRITLEVTGVRVERLQAISEADALAEGIVRLHDGGYGLPAGEHYHSTDPRQSYFSLWEAINGPGSVAANPWVWRVEFKRFPA